MKRSPSNGVGPGGAGRTNRRPVSRLKIQATAVVLLVSASGCVASQQSKYQGASTASGAPATALPSGQGSPAPGAGSGSGQRSPAPGSGSGSGQGSLAPGSGQGSPAPGAGSDSGQRSPAPGSGSGQESPASASPGPTHLPPRPGGTLKVNVQGPSVPNNSPNPVKGDPRQFVGSVGTVTPPSLWTITDEGPGDVAIGSVQLQGAAEQFIITGNHCANATLSPAQACTIQISFAPRSEGFFKARLLVEHYGADSPFVDAISGWSMPMSPGPCTNC